jgi:two-component system NarL family sensor kinase
MTVERDPSRRSNGIAQQVARIASENARLFRLLAQNEGRLRMVSMRVVRVQEAERGRISRELHDSIGQSLTALRIQLDLLHDTMTAEAHPLAPRLAALRELADRSLQDVRGLSRLLRPQMLDDLGLVPTLRWLFREFYRSANLDIEFVDNSDGLPIDPDVATLTYRVAQEALTNVAKHARTASAQVRLDVAPTRLVFTIADPGVGFDARAAMSSSGGAVGFGLRSMRDRVQLLGGQLTVHSTPGHGTRIEIDVPLSPAGEDQV